MEGILVKTGFRWAALVALFACFTITVQAQKSGKQERIDSTKARVEAKSYTFHATNASGKRGRTINIAGDQNRIVVRPDIIKCDLPFYGESYGGAGGYAPTSNGPLTFETKDFIYQSKPGKKGGWNISIKPKDVPDIQEIIISIGVEGYASATVTSQNRSVMNYTGEVY
ncbi:MAG TPA: DUF4251 domain-containing protein [Phnomibacter sp.]|nr:DUF4251 domain-containing protein [Phnomibacter sp.]